ncbi:hypothetical protein HK102_005589 [Quaeritorhiza haematococci]|nr:hypothetical protein HK102_005589 [Quaeritorhiza haematococci]
MGPKSRQTAASTGRYRSSQSPDRSSVDLNSRYRGSPGSYATNSSEDDEESILDDDNGEEEGPHNSGRRVDEDLDGEEEEAEEDEEDYDRRRRDHKRGRSLDTDDMDSVEGTPPPALNKRRGVTKEQPIRGGRGGRGSKASQTKALGKAGGGGKNAQKGKGRQASSKRKGSVVEDSGADDNESVGTRDLNDLIDSSSISVVDDEDEDELRDDEDEDEGEDEDEEALDEDVDDTLSRTSDSTPKGKNRKTSAATASSGGRFQKKAGKGKTPSSATKGKANVTETAKGEKVTKRKRGQGSEQKEDDVDSEEEWLRSIEDGDIDALNMGVSKKAMTVRQKALQNVDTEAMEELLELPEEPSKKKKMTPEEALLRKSELARRRKNQTEQKAEEDKQATINKLLKKQASKRRAKDVDQETSEPIVPHTIRYIKRNDGTASLSLPPKAEIPSIYEPSVISAYPQPQRCSVEGCTDIQRYKHSKTLRPVCSLEHYRLVG